MNLIIRNARYVDSQQGVLTADIAIEQGRIIAIGGDFAEGMCRTVDASSCVVLAGFIDVHSHTDESALQDSSVSKLLQGVTTEICGQCGGSPAPIYTDQGQKVRKAVKYEEDYWNPVFDWRSMDEYFDVIDSRGVAVNQALFAGWWTIYDDNRFAGKQQPFGSALQSVHGVARQGAAGLSLNQESATWKELTRTQRCALFDTAAQAGLMVSVHLQSYDYRLSAHIREVCQLASETGAQLQLSHIKFIGQQRRQLRTDFFSLMEEAGVDPQMTGFDVVPFDSICTRLRNFYQRVVDEWQKEGESCYFDQFYRVVSLASGWELIRGEGWSEQDFEQLASYTRGSKGAECVEAFGLDEADIDLLLSDQRSYIGSDASSTQLIDANSRRFHRRTFETFPTAVEKLQAAGLNVEDISVKLSRRPAERFGLRDRGMIAVGYKADLLIFETVAETEKIQIKNRPRDVLVNGELAVSHGCYTGEMGGRALRGSCLDSC